MGKKYPIDEKVFHHSIIKLKIYFKLGSIPHTIAKITPSSEFNGGYKFLLISTKTSIRYAKENDREREKERERKKGTLLKIKI